jgi:hypothetical protein
MKIEITVKCNSEISASKKRKYGGCNVQNYDMIKFEDMVNVYLEVSTAVTYFIVVSDL